MYNIFRLLSFFIFLVLFSCGTSTNTTYVNPHAAPHIQMHQEFKDEENQKIIQEISGKYSGSIPCSDCEHINYVIELRKDLTYNLWYSYVGKSEIIIEKSGKFILSNRLTIQLDNAANGMNLLKKTQKGLLLLDKNGNEFSGELEEQYNLHLVKLNTENYKFLKQQFLTKKWNNSIGFYAFGNEPSWSLDINFDKSMHLKNLEFTDLKKSDKNINCSLSSVDGGENTPIWEPSLLFSLKYSLVLASCLKRFISNALALPEPISIIFDHSKSLFFISDTISQPIIMFI